MTKPDFIVTLSSKTRLKFDKTVSIIRQYFKGPPPILLHPVTQSSTSNYVKHDWIDPG